MTIAGRRPLPELTREALSSRVGLVSGLAMLFGCLAVYVGVQKPTYVIGGIFALLFFVFAHRNPLLGLIVLFAVGFLEQVLGQFTGGSSTAAALAAKGTGGVLVLVWILRWATRRDEPIGGPVVRAFVFTAAALLVWSLASALWADDPHASLSATFRLAQGPLLMIVMVAFVRDRASLALLCLAYVAGAAVSAGTGFFGLVPSVDAGRLVGGVGDPNFLAAVLVAAFTVALFTGLAPGRSLSYRVVVLGLGLFCLVGIILTGSRGGVLALALVFVLAVVYAGPIRAQLLGVALVVVAVAALYAVLFAPAQTVSRLGSAGSGTGRTDLWTVAMNAFEKHPVRGVGLDNFVVVSPTYVAATNTDLPRVDVVVTQHAPVHNTYLQIAAELGVVGLVLLVAMLGVVLESARRAVRLAASMGDTMLELVGRGLVVGTAGMLVAFVFLTAQYEKQLWLTLGLPLAFATATRRVAAARGAAEADS